MAQVPQNVAASRPPSEASPAKIGQLEPMLVDGAPTDMPYSVRPRRPTGYGRATANQYTDATDPHSGCRRVRPGDRVHRRVRFTLVHLFKGGDVELERSVPPVETYDRRRAVLSQCIGVGAPPPHVSVKRGAAGITSRRWYALAGVEAWSTTETGGVRGDGDGAHWTAGGLDGTPSRDHLGSGACLPLFEGDRTSSSCLHDPPCGPEWVNARARCAIIEA